MLEGFEAWNRKSEFRLSVFYNYLSISRGILNALGNPANLGILFNDKTNQLAIVADQTGLSVKDNKHGNHRINSVGLVSEIKVRTKRKNLKFEGKLCIEGSAVIFDLD